MAGRLPVARIAKPHDPATAAETEGGRLVVQQRGLLAKSFHADLGDSEWIGRVAGDDGCQAVGALAHQARIGSVEENCRDRCVDAAQEGVDIPAGDPHRSAADPQPPSWGCSARARRVRMSSLMARAPRSRASSCEITEANCEDKMS